MILWLQQQSLTSLSSVETFCHYQRSGVARVIFICDVSVSIIVCVQ